VAEIEPTLPSRNLRRSVLVGKLDGAYLRHTLRRTPMLHAAVMRIFAAAHGGAAPSRLFVARCSTLRYPRPVERRPIADIRRGLSG
jgi:hypothetical protein